MDNAITRPLILALGLPFPAAHILLGLANLGTVTSIWNALAAMAICLVLMAVVTWPGKGRTLPRFHAAMAVVGVVLMDLLVMTVLPSDVHPGYAAWHCGAIEMLMVTVAMRNRVALAWLGISLFAILDFSGSMLHRLSVVDGLALVVTPLMWIGIATAVSKVLRRCVDQARTYTSQETEAAVRLAREEARRLAQTHWTRELDRLARPSLELIARGPLSEQDRQDCALLEAQLRDQIRGRALATPEVLRAARRARARGVKVDILDDRETELSTAVLSEASALLSTSLENADGGFVRGRALPSGSKTAVTILAYDESADRDEVYVEIRERQPTE
ncbi:hypothetical protein ACHMXB_12065 [Arthrobacter sp. UC242_113]|uniref:hypothetical protein n=1 Tax=Arthrobacter sp. UC242_113 TaxID=3374550 RepID=UPI00375755B0